MPTSYRDYPEYYDELDPEEERRTRQIPEFETWKAGWGGIDGKYIDVTKEVRARAPYFEAGYDVTKDPWLKQFETGGQIGGWYTDPNYIPVSPGQGTSFTGAPQTFEEAEFIKAYFAKHGERPTGREVAGYYGSLPGAGTVNDPYRNLPGSTGYDRGFWTGAEESSAERHGLDFGPHWGKDIPQGGGVVVKDAQGKPYLRFVSPAHAKEMGFGDPASYIDKSRTDIYGAPRQPAKPFTPPKMYSMQEFLSASDPTDVYMAKVQDYLVQQYLGTSRELGKEDPTQMEAYNNAIAKVEAAIATGLPVNRMPFYKESFNTTGEQTELFYQGYKQQYPQMVETAKLAYQEQGMGTRDLGRPGATGDWSGGAAQWGGGSPYVKQPELSPVQIAINTEKTGYDAWIGGLQLDEENKFWLQQNYPSLVQTWMNYGQGMTFINWAKQYLKGQITPPPSDTRRYQPPARYR